MSESYISLSGSRTDIGRVREHNEDSLIVHPPLYAVADGMGGHEAGEVASEIAIESLLASAPAHPDAKALARSVRSANAAVLRGVDEGQGRSGMGTTMTAALVEGTRVVVAQVGDSRAYLLHDGELQRLTKDHSLVADLVERGVITETEARYHPKRSVITRALGSDENMSPDVYEFDTVEGDRLLLCSDGLTGMIDDDHIKRILVENRDPQQAADELIDAANEAGGHDNVTAIVVDISEKTHEAPTSKKSKKWLASVLIWVFAVILVAALGAGGLYYYAQNSAYLGEEDGHVMLYRGLPGTVAGISLSWPEESTSIKVDDLSASQRQKLRDGWVLNSFSEAQSQLDSLEDQVKAKEKNKSGDSSKGSSSGMNSASDE